jgi:predicted alpha/beta-fold hydrolase
MEPGQEQRCVSVICSLDFCTASTLDRLNGSFVGKHVYSQGMGGNLLNLLKLHASSLASFGNERVNEAVANGLALQKPTIEAFDNTFTRLADGSSPPFPFSSTDEYYLWSSSDTVLPRVRIPFLAINAADDPLIPVVPLDAGGNPWAVMVLSSGGGHLGWFEAAPCKGRVQRWVRKPVLEWLKVAGELLVHGHRVQPLIEKDGFIVEIGREHLGCKKVEDIVAVEDVGEDRVVKTRIRGFFRTSRMECTQV